MKKFILLLTCFFCLSTSVFAEFAPNLAYGVKFNNTSTGIHVYPSGDNLIEWAGLESNPSFDINFDFEWYHKDLPIYGGISVNLDLGDIISSGTGFKFGFYNNYINLFCKAGFSYLEAEMSPSENVGWRYNGDSSKIDSFTFSGFGFNLGIGLDLHPFKESFFIRLSYNHEIYNPDLEIKTQKFTIYTDSKDIIGDNDFHNRSFTISVGWQFRRKNIVKEVVPEDKKSSENVLEASFKFADVPTMTYSDLYSIILDALFEKGITTIEEPTIKEVKD